ncbi:MAG: tetratricopeptide repeat protein [Verrucomicrobiota bacterium]
MKEPEPTESPKPTPVEVVDRRHPDDAFDDPLHDWWVKNGKSIIGGAILAVVITAVVFGFRAYRTSQEEVVQAAYNAAVSTDTLSAFALDYAGHPLAGVAALQTANIAFQDGDWEQASEFYTVATTGLSGNPLEGKARLGLAMAQSKLGNNVEAVRILSALGNDENRLPADRIEASYFLALLSLEAGNLSEFEAWSTKVAELDSSGMWLSKLDYFADRVEIPVSDTSVAPAEQTTAEEVSQNAEPDLDAAAEIAPPTVPEPVPAPAIDDIPEVSEQAPDSIAESTPEAPSIPESEESDSAE